MRPPKPARIGFCCHAEFTKKTSSAKAYDARLMRRLLVYVRPYGLARRRGARLL